MPVNASIYKSSNLSFSHHYDCSMEQVTDVVEQLKILIRTELQKYAEKLAKQVALVRKCIIW